MPRKDKDGVVFETFVEFRARGGVAKKLPTHRFGPISSISYMTGGTRKSLASYLKSKKRVRVV
jgi:hypothetical protein